MSFGKASRKSMKVLDLPFFRHLQQAFKKAGIIVAQEIRQGLDRVICVVASGEYRNCLAAWKEVKKHMVEDERSFLPESKERWGKHS